MKHKISIEILQKLPTGKPLRVEEVTDMSGKKRMAVKWIWVDLREPHPRKAHFCLETGEYLGECW